MGIVPGGGATLLYLNKFEEELKAEAVADGEDEDFIMGIDIVFKCLSAPMMQIAENAGQSCQLERHLSASSQELRMFTSRVDIEFK